MLNDEAVAGAVAAAARCARRPASIHTAIG
jgi:hypothetical protein